MLQVSLITVNYNKRSVCCPSFRSTAVRRVIIPFTAFNSNSCVMADKFWQMTTFSAESNADRSGYPFDFEKSYNQMSQGVRSVDLGGHA